MVTPHTEHPDLAHTLGIPRLFLKREDLHPYGSHKGRSIPLMIEMHVARGARDFAISSSGNAARAAAQYVRLQNSTLSASEKLSLTIFVGEHIDPEKEALLDNEAKRDEHIVISRSPRPLQALFGLLKGKKHQSLRQSQDDAALTGYKTLAEELVTIPDLRTVFIPTSSGTTAQALAHWFGTRTPSPSVHIVQTTSCHPMADAFEKTDSLEPSTANAIVDKVAHRKSALMHELREHNGSGWIATNKEIEEARSMLARIGIETTANGALGLAGLIHARTKGAVFDGSVVCVITGK